MIDRTPGRLVVWALICLYLGPALLVIGSILGGLKLAIVLVTLAQVPAMFCVPLILIAIVMRLTAPK